MMIHACAYQARVLFSHRTNSSGELAMAFLNQDSLSLFDDEELLQRLATSDDDHADADFVGVFKNALRVAENDSAYEDSHPWGDEISDFLLPNHIVISYSQVCIDKELDAEDMLEFLLKAVPASLKQALQEGPLGAKS